jgi:hypothetical protein
VKLIKLIKELPKEEQRVLMVYNKQVFDRILTYRNQQFFDGRFPVSLDWDGWIELPKYEDLDVAV